MLRCRFTALTIASAGYDAQSTILEVEFARDGQIWQYFGVPEELWYRFRKESGPDVFFRRFIQGCYTEKRIFSDVNSTDVR